jgi:hypothetical protein
MVNCVSWIPDSGVLLQSIEIEHHLRISVKDDVGKILIRTSSEVCRV